MRFRICINYGITVLLQGSTLSSTDRLSWFESVYSATGPPPRCDGVIASASRLRWSAALLRVLGTVRALSTGCDLGLSVG